MKEKFNLVVNNVKGKKKPTIGTKYWTYYFNPKTGWKQVVQADWKNDRIDNERWGYGRVFSTKAQADVLLERRLNIIKKIRRDAKQK